ncbi:unnamed protein product [Sphagnum jensenii]
MAARIMMAFLEVGNGQRTGRENQGQENRTEERRDTGGPCFQLVAGGAGEARQGAADLDSYDRERISRIGSLRLVRTDRKEQEGNKALRESKGRLVEEGGGALELL